MSNEIQPFEFEGNKVRALADGDGGDVRCI